MGTDRSEYKSKVSEEYGMEKVLKYASIGLASLGIGLGVAAADSADIGTTGPSSTNKVEISRHHDLDIDNDNNVDVDNDNDQEAKTGDAKVYGNTTGGDAESGDAENSNETSTEVSITNSGAGSWAPMWGGNGSSSASIDTTGPNSYNSIKFNYHSSVDVNNDNDVDVNNNNDQYAKSGSATVQNNTTGGNAVSGSAVNTNSTSTSVHISN